MPCGAAPSRRFNSAGERAGSVTAGGNEGEKNEIDKSCAESVENGGLTIPAAEEIIEEALNELAYSQDPGLVRALRFLAPPGYQAIVELCSENGRSKRRNASADTWSPEDDEVRIYFERIDGEEPAPRSSRVPRPVAGRAAEEEDEDRGGARLPIWMRA